MSEENSIEKLFSTLLKDKFEKRIIHLIIQGKASEEIIETLISSNDKD